MFLFANVGVKVYLVGNHEYSDNLSIDWHLVKARMSACQGIISKLAFAYFVLMNTTFKLIHKNLINTFVCLLRLTYAAL